MSRRPAGCRHQLQAPHLHRWEIPPSSQISCRPCSWAPSGRICQHEPKTGSDAVSTQNFQISLYAPAVTHSIDLLPQVGIPFILKLSVRQISSVSTGFFWRKSGENRKVAGFCVAMILNSLKWCSKWIIFKLSVFVSVHSLVNTTEMDILKLRFKKISSVLPFFPLISAGIRHQNKNTRILRHQPQGRQTAARGQHITRLLKWF